MTGSKNLPLSRQDAVDKVAMDVGEAEIAALELVGEALVVDSEKMEHSGMEIVHGGSVHFSIVSEIVRRSVSGAAFDAPAG